MHGGISADNLAARIIGANHLVADLLLATVIRVGDNNILLDGRDNVMPAVSVFDKQSVQVERVRMGQLGSDTTDWGLVIRDRNDNVIISQDGLGIGVVGDVNIEGDISADHISSDVLNVVTLYTGVCPRPVRPRKHSPPYRMTETITV